MRMTIEERISGALVRECGSKERSETYSVVSELVGGGVAASLNSAGLDDASVSSYREKAGEEISLEDKGAGQKFQH